MGARTDQPLVQGAGYPIESLALVPSSRVQALGVTAYDASRDGKAKPCLHSARVRSNKICTLRNLLCERGSLNTSPANAHHVSYPLSLVQVTLLNPRPYESPALL